MNRAFLSASQALTGVAGVLVLLKVCIEVPAAVLAAMKAGLHYNTFWIVTAPGLIEAFFGVALVFSAVCIHQVLGASNPVIKEPVPIEKW